MRLDGLLGEIEEVRALIERHEEVLVFGHKDADGDTLGCSLAFAEALHSRGKRVQVVIPAPLPVMYSWLPGFDQIADGPPPGFEAGLVLFFDAGSLERSGKAARHIGEHAKIVNIDHHLSNSRFGDVNIIQATASAVGEIVLDMLEHYGWDITPAMATNLYTAILTDTGGFRHENTTPAALADGARLAVLGADPGHIATMVYKSRPLTTLKLQALSLASMQVEVGGRLAWARVTKRMLREAEAVMAESEGIIDTLNSIAGLEVAVIFKEVSGRVTKISVRSRGDLDAAALCARFGGGGHFRAAGAEVAMAMDDAVEAVRQAAMENLETAAGTGAGRGSKRR